MSLIDDIQDTEDGRVAAWRLEQFKMLGINEEQALHLAICIDVDRQQVEELHNNGCPDALIVSILV
jgi:hypothetical protein